MSIKKKWNSILWRLMAVALLFCLWLPRLGAAPMSDDEAREKYGLHATMRDEWLIAAWDWVCDTVSVAYEWVRDQVSGMLFDDMEVETADQVGLVLPMLLALLMLFSGCWAASIAQMRRHPRPLFFLAGFIGVLVVPLYLLFRLDIKGEKELLARFADEAAKKKAEVEAKAAIEEAAAKENGLKQEPAVSESGVVWDKKYFESIAHKEDGSLSGPWDVVYNGGIRAHVLAILEVQETFVQVRYVNMAGKEMTGRLPLAKLEEWKDA